ncbi:MBL fold metallo-hydrolase [Thiocystis violacea]|uniref:MBL fold metallo-hydrolase n=1 Tax=Thiocystis violacea TaxID=13725 RepID=UPI001908D191|nr:MBL fold metallo-hydrolase [Thiocystis violacea]MBK1720027.1 hypothetical protein [Thiocystis violacea]
MADREYAVASAKRRLINCEFGKAEFEILRDEILGRSLTVSTPARFSVRLLGQSGCRMEFPNCVIYVDPYLSDSVRELDASDMVRQVPIPQSAAETIDATWLLLTHDHIDHCDPHTIPQMAQASSGMRMLGPFPVLERLRSWGFDESRLVLAEECWQALAPDIRVRAVPAAHPEIVRNPSGHLACVGYLIEYLGHLIYHAGDTALTQAVIDGVVMHGPVHTAFLPVNERNFFRERRGIIGNMSVRDAFGFAEEIKARQVVPVHWDMFAANEALPEEIRAVYRRMQPNFGLLLSPRVITLADVRITVIIRTLNEARHLSTLLSRLPEQDLGGLGHEVVLVDSGSTDGTLEIAERYGCRILHVGRKEFSFGRSLNRGCQAAQGDILAIISGHCLPTDRQWLARLCRPLLDDEANYSFGRQLGGVDTHFSEQRIFAKYFPESLDVGQKSFYCNNANAALRYSDWERLRFDENLTGLEDMELAQRLVGAGGRVVYVPEAAVYHHHQESWGQIQRRFEREALALRRIMPQVHVGAWDVARYFVTSVYKDWICAWREGIWPRTAWGVVRYRWHQYRGIYEGNRQHRILSHSEKEKYFYPE